MIDVDDDVTDVTVVNCRVGEWSEMLSLVDGWVWSVYL